MTGEKASRTPQYFATFAAQVSSITMGALNGWPAVALPKIRVDPRIGGITEEQISLIAAVLHIGMILGAFPAGLVVDYCGRRKSILWITAPTVASWAMIYFARSFELMVAGRVLGGSCYSVYIIGAPAYVAEISDAKIRGILVSTMHLVGTLGILAVFGIGAVMDWDILTLACGVVPIISHILMMFTPESPRFLASKGQHEEAAKSLAWLHGLEPEDVKEELDLIIESIEKAEGGDGPKRSQCQEFCRTGTLKTFFVCFVLFFLQVYTGADTIQAYAADIFASTAVWFDEFTSTVFMGVGNVLGCVVGLFMIDSLGRKHVINISLLILGSGTGMLGYFYYARKLDRDWAVEKLYWMPVTAMNLILFGYSVGIAPAPHAILAELLPQNIRGFGKSLIRILRGTMLFLLTMFFKDALKDFGEDLTYWALAILAVLGIFYVHFAVPETKGQTLEQIQEKVLANDMKGFSKKNKNADDSA